MPWIRRPKHDDQPASKRLPDLDFLALVKAGLEELAPGVTRGAEVKGSSLLSPSGWAVGVMPCDHGDDHHYGVVAFPDVSMQPDVPCFVGCVGAVTGILGTRPIRGWRRPVRACWNSSTNAGSSPTMLAPITSTVSLAGT